MKPVAHMKNEYRRYFAVMIICFVVGGFAITAFFIEAYTNLLGREFLGFRPRLENLTNVTDALRRGDTVPPVPGRSLAMLSPFVFVLLLSGIVLIIGGIALWSLTREKELKHTREKLTDLLLLPDEKTVIQELRKSNGEMTQSQLVIKTGLSKVKVHRVVKSLTLKGIIKKYEYGLTNKIILEKEIISK
jgi:uncharacterized membrane protein